MTNFVTDLTNYLCSTTENLVRDICRELGKEEEIERLLKKYLNGNKVTLNKKKQTQVKNKRKKTSYSMFLKYNTIRKENPNMTLEEYNIYKGEYWKNISKEEKKRYENLAEEWNNQNKTTKELKKEEKIEVEEPKKDKEVDLLDCFFDDEYLKNKNVEKTIEEI